MTSRCTLRVLAQKEEEAFHVNATRTRNTPPRTDGFKGLFVGSTLN